MTPAAPKRKLAINRLRDRKPLDGAAVDRFLARNEVPIVEGARCTFLYRGEADEVRLVQRVVGLPEQIPMRRLHGTDLWYLVLELPEGSRVNYQLEVRRGERGRAAQRPAQPQALLQPCGHVLGVLRARLRDPGVDRSTTRRHARARSRRWWCRVGPCGATAR